MSQDGIRDHSKARCKAVVRLGIAPHNPMPSNNEIDAAIAEYQRLFCSSEQPGHLAHLRQIALEAMFFLRAYSPRLVGSVLTGTADRFSPIMLYVYAETSEEIYLDFIDARIPFSEISHTIVENGKNTELPAFRFIVDDAEVILNIQPLKSLSQGMKKQGRNRVYASLKEVRALINRG